MKGIEPKNLIEKRKELESYIINQQKLRALMAERKSYFDFYIRNKDINEDEAYAAYKKYKQCQYEIEELRKK